MRWDLRAVKELDTGRMLNMNVTELKQLDRFLAQVTTKRLTVTGGVAGYKSKAESLLEIAGITPIDTGKRQILKGFGYDESLPVREVREIPSNDKLEIISHIEKLKDFVNAPTTLKSVIKEREKTESIARNMGIDSKIVQTINLLQETGDWNGLKQKYGGSDKVIEEIERIASEDEDYTIDDIINIIMGDIEEMRRADREAEYGFMHLGD